MSAFVVANGCLDDVVTFRMKVEGCEYTEAKAIEIGNKWKAEMLKFNEDSVNHRYGVDEHYPMAPFAVSVQSIDQLMQSAICWIYQSCEHDDPVCEALSDSLEAYINANYPDRDKREGYKLTEWDRH